MTERRGSFHNSPSPSYLKRGIAWHEAEASHYIGNSPGPMKSYLTGLAPLILRLRSGQGLGGGLSASLRKDGMKAVVFNRNLASGSI
jgi:hypothetical protein